MHTFSPADITKVSLVKHFLLHLLTKVTQCWTPYSNMMRGSAFILSFSCHVWLNSSQHLTAQKADRISESFKKNTHDLYVITWDWFCQGADGIVPTTPSLIHHLQTGLTLGHGCTSTAGFLHGVPLLSRDKNSHQTQHTESRRVYSSPSISPGPKHVIQRKSILIDFHSWVFMSNIIPARISKIHYGHFFFDKLKTEHHTCRYIILSLSLLLF